MCTSVYIFQTYFWFNQNSVSIIFATKGESVTKISDVICHKYLSLLCFCLSKGDKEIFLLVENIFWTNESVFLTYESVFLSPYNKQKQRSDKFL